MKGNMGLKIGTTVVLICSLALGLTVADVAPPDGCCPARMGTPYLGSQDINAAFPNAPGMAKTDFGLACPFSNASEHLQRIKQMSGSPLQFIPYLGIGTSLWVVYSSGNEILVTKDTAAKEHAWIGTTDPWALNEIVLDNGSLKIGRILNLDKGERDNATILVRKNAIVKDHPFGLLKEYNLTRALTPVYPNATWIDVEEGPSRAVNATEFQAFREKYKGFLSTVDDDHVTRLMLALGMPGGAAFSYACGNDYFYGIGVYENNTLRLEQIITVPDGNQGIITKDIARIDLSDYTPISVSQKMPGTVGGAWMKWI